MFEESWFKRMSNHCKQADETREPYPSTRGLHRIVFERFDALPLQAGISTETKEFECCNEKWSVLIRREVVRPDPTQRGIPGKVSVDLKYAGHSAYAIKQHDHAIRLTDKLQAFAGTVRSPVERRRRRRASI